MKLPLKLKGFNLFFEGLNLYGLVADVTRPKVVFKTEDYRPGGLDVDLKIEQGIEPLELEFTVGGYAAEILREMGGSIAGKVLRKIISLRRTLAIMRNNAFRQSCRQPFLQLVTRII